MDGRQQLLAAYFVALGFAGYNAWTADTPAWNTPLPDPGTVLHTSVFFGLLGVAEPIIGEPVTALLGWGTLVALILAKTSKTAGGSIVGAQGGTAASGIGAGIVGAQGGAAVRAAGGK